MCKCVYNQKAGIIGYVQFFFPFENSVGFNSETVYKECVLQNDK